MIKINFQNDVTKVNEDTMNTFQDNIEDAINIMSTKKQTSYISDNTAKGAIVNVPFYYIVGNGSLDVYLNGERLIKSSNEAGTDGHYVESGEMDSISNKIKLTTDWNLEAGDVLDFVVRGDYSAT